MMYWLVNILTLLVLLGFWYRTLPAQERLVFALAVAARLAAGVALGLLYTYYYIGEGDTFLFFHDATLVTSAGRGDFGLFLQFPFSADSGLPLVNNQPRSLFFIWIVAGINFFTGSSYWLTSLWLSLFSFAGAWYLVRKIAQGFPRLRWAAAIAFLFFPSVVFWSSGVIKESLAFGGLCFLSGFLFTLFTNTKPRMGEYALAAVSLYLLLNLKYYWAAVFFPSVATAWLIRLWPLHRYWSLTKMATIWMVILVATCLLVSQLHPNFYLQNFLEVIKTNHDAFVAFSQQTLYIHYYQLEASWSSMAVNAPWALLSGLVRPFLFEARSPLQVLGGLENLLLLVLFLFQIFRVQVPSGNNRLVFFSLVTYVSVLCIFLALSTPNFGTLSRYRIGFLPYFVFLLMMHVPFLRQRTVQKIIKRVTPFR
ncbi:MAG: hypothetical protein ACOYXA_07770 [Bacteroidota bacterium]